MAAASTLASRGLRGAAPGGAAPSGRGGRAGRFYEATAAGSKHSPPPETATLLAGSPAATVVPGYASQKEL